MSVRLHFHGAAGCVTGACFRLTSARAHILIDCGLFQGPKTLKALNYQPFPFEPASLDCVLLTHAHIDHAGLIPKLFKAGFDHDVYATPDTAQLCGVLLPDAGAIQETEVEALNRRRRRLGEDDLEPIFTVEDAHAALDLLRTIPLGEWRSVAPGVRARFWHAGHILGAASIEVEIADAETTAPLRLLFSGDVGPGGRDLTDDPDGPSDIDHLILESTYGGTERPALSTEHRRARLAEVVCAAHAAGGPLLIPAFAVERTQELLVDLIDLMERTIAPPGTIFLDSPLAIKACDVFLRRREGAGENPYRVLRESRLLQFTESVTESRSLERTRGWHVIVAASGMCDAGRVRHHLKRLLCRPEATVMLVGFQPVGTLGRLLIDGRRTVTIQGDPVRVRASVTALDIYSGHADGPGLTRWAAARRPVRGRVFLTHGEPRSLQSLRERLVETGFPEASVTIAELDAAYDLRKADAEPAPASPRLAPDRVARLDWHNARADFLTVLDRALRTAGTDADREALVARLRAVVSGAAP